MSHNIDSLMYVGQVPWHKLGKRLDQVATASEAIKAAGLDWTVSKEPIFLNNGRKVDRHYAVVRADTGKALGVVGENYRPLQNRESFSFFDAVIGVKEAVYHTAGSLGSGERVWLLAKLPGYIKVVGEDVTEKFLLLSNSHDGTSSVQILWTPIRVVCQNTLNVGISQGSRKQKLRHTRSLGLKVRDVQAGLGIINERFRLFEESAQALTRVQIGVKGWRDYCRAVGILPASDADITTRSRNVFEEVSALFEHGKGNDLPGVRGSAWAGFNAVVEYVDHGRGENKSLEARASSLLWGSGARLKQAAWDTALELAR